MRTFFTLAAAISLSVMLGGCPGQIPTSVNNPVGLNQLAAAEQSYNAVMDPVVALIEQPTCRNSQIPSLSDPCVTYSLKIKLQAGILKAQSARRKLSTFVRQNPTLDASALLRNLATALDALKAAQGG